MALRSKWFTTAVCCALAVGGPVRAQSCTAEDLASAVDQAGAKLREIMTINQPKIDAKVKALAGRRGWPDAVATEQALAAIADARIDALDRTANELLARIDTLGALATNAVPECGRIQDVEASSLELQAAMRAKSTYVMTRLDAVMAEALKTADAAQPPDTARPIEAPKLLLSTPPAMPTPMPTAPRPRASEQPWTTTTTVDPPTLSPPAVQTVPPPVQDEGYTREEIVRASSGFFGQVSAQIAAAVERSFSAVGRPTGYILGEEGGGAFLAGLRYGKGTLYLRSGGTAQVYWHGPSLGADIGAAGAKVMFLAYRLRDVDQLQSPFTSLDGQAYVAGGVGVTLMTNGDVQMAPVRAGVGLRLGASLGYVRFTRRPTWNPF